MALPLSGLILLTMWSGQVCPNTLPTRYTSVRQHSGPMIAYARAAGPAETIQSPTIAQLSKQWIGVRMTPVPEPLAAHIGSDGMMIANIAKDSPADQAGLERYDVIVSFDGQKIDDMDELMTAVNDAKVGVKTEIVVIRKGQKQKVAIAPAERPAAAKLEFKYEEPPEDLVDRSLNMRGLTLRHGPDGKWLWEELGPLGQVPDVLKNLNGLDHLNLKDLKPEDLDVDVRIFDHSLDDLGTQASPDAKARVQMNVRIEEDGQTTTIQRDADGKVQFDRVDADGKKTSETYESMDDFREKNPDGFQLYRRFAGSGARAFIVRPGADQLDKARRQFQVEVQRKLENAAKGALDQAKTAEERAKVLQEHVEQLNKAHAGQSTGTAKSLSVQINDEGKVTVTTSDGGRRKVYVFDSKEEFKQSEPDLYEKVKGLLE